MYPPGPYSVSRGSFETSVDPPTTQPTAAPVQQICVNQDWLPYIVGALKQLELQATWKVANDAALLDVQGRVFDLMALFEKGTAGCSGVQTPTKLCLSASFADDQYGYASPGSAPCPAPWISGTGFQDCHDAGTNERAIVLERMFAATEIRSFAFVANAGGGPGFNWQVDLFLNAANVFSVSGSTLAGGDTAFTASPNAMCDTILVQVRRSSIAPGGSLTLHDFTMCYNGGFPLDVPPHQTVWTHTFDFSVSDGGWVSAGGGANPNGGTWTGSRWESQFNPHGSTGDCFLNIFKTFPATTLTSIDVFFHANVANGAFRAVLTYDGGTINSNNGLPSGAGDFAQHTAVSVLSDQLQVSIDSTGVSAADINYCTKVVVSGVGSDPF